MSRLYKLKTILYLDNLDRQKIIHNGSRLLKKKVLAEWKPINIHGPELMKTLTNAMTYNSNIRINYKNSGWRSILPYGWNTSKNGNVLVMCYKDTGEIRSYRLDRIFDVLVNSDIEQYSDDSSLTWNDFQMPTLPNLEQIIEETEAEVDETLPYDTGLKALTTNELPSQEEIKETDQNIDGEDLNDIVNMPEEEISEPNESDESEETNTSENTDESKESDNTEEDNSEQNESSNENESDNDFENDSEEQSDEDISKDNKNLSEEEIDIDDIDLSDLETVEDKENE